MEVWLFFQMCLISVLSVDTRDFLPIHECVFGASRANAQRGKWNFSGLTQAKQWEQETCHVPTHLPSK